MAEELKPELCVIGAGAAGLAAAEAAAALGASVVLIEKGRMGGEHLNTACVPSKAMLAAARRAEAFRSSGPFGIKLAKPAVEFDEVNDHVHRVINAIAPNESRERLAGLRVRVIEGEARFRDTRTVAVGQGHDGGDDVRFEVRARRFIIATGSKPQVPEISGLDQCPYFTNETIFEARERPKHLIVVGAGQSGLELAQAFRRLGSEVSVLELDKPLAQEDPECAAIVLDALEREGVTIRGGVKVERVRTLRQRIEVVLAGDTEETIQGTDLLVAVGRRPNIAGLNLESARVKVDPAGIVVNKRFGTTNRRIYAIGDVTSLPHSTHSAQQQAALLVKHLLFRLPVGLQVDEIPRVTFTEPELAHVGLTYERANEVHGGAVRLLRWPYLDNDRAQTERETHGHIKVVTDTKGLILGVTIVGAAASEQISTWTLAINHGLNIRAMADLVVPYPTYMEVGKRAAISFFAPKLSTSWVRRLSGLLRRFG
ncbi:dihydrolipoyl dehydrogenase family protein [Rhodoplanes sp. Z2-YC6860]|uniref:dihydrolipoyl dehydrogenase family protein n=1 Tax=Rhodoplanes sp. Z2-YC6860 TaxID=674703 RepID=UPI00078C180F|nr:NAD(P)/FAD-dependent oxidoreductase [Rhodoplanes sp. Z2-YC6860]AMN45049.1 pyridine nucleotide-disulfide oxidoreductase dimerization region [Rhodoplanes sp. Z2-YC6860]